MALMRHIDDLNPSQQTIVAARPGSEAELVADVEQDQQAAGHADGQAEDVEGGVGAVLEQVAQRRGQIVAEHAAKVGISADNGKNDEGGWDG